MRDTMPRWSKAEIQKLRQCIADGMSAAEAATVLGRTRKSVLSKAREHGLGPWATTSCPRSAMPPDSLLRPLLAKRTASEVFEMMQAQGYTISRTRCDTLRGLLIASGEAEPVSPRDYAKRIELYGDPAADAQAGSEALQQAIRALYARTAKRLRCSPKAAEIVLNYSPAQIRKMAA